ncbi:Uncharacterised protein [Mycobacteroides abscessus]|nr:Uncharacterised protein [Mycobacteroides abscessus]
MQHGRGHGRQGQHHPEPDEEPADGDGVAHDAEQGEAREDARPPDGDRHDGAAAERGPTQGAAQQPARDLEQDG